MCALLVQLVPAAACGAGSDWEGGIHARMAHSAEAGVRVVEVPPDGPAARAGLEAGDRILSIDGVPVEGLGAHEVARRLRGRVGDAVELRVDRAGRPMTFRVDRAPYGD